MSTNVKTYSRIISRDLRLSIVPTPYTSHDGEDVVIAYVWFDDDKSKFTWVLTTEKLAKELYKLTDNIKDVSEGKFMLDYDPRPEDYVSMFDYDNRLPARLLTPYGLKTFNLSGNAGYMPLTETTACQNRADDKHYRKMFWEPKAINEVPDFDELRYVYTDSTSILVDGQGEMYNLPVSGNALSDNGYDLHGIIEAAKTDDRIRLLNDEGIYHVSGNGLTLNVTVLTTSEVSCRTRHFYAKGKLQTWEALPTALAAIGYSHLVPEDKINLGE